MQGSKKTCQKNFDSILLVYKYFFLTKTNPPLGLTRKSINFSKLEVDLKRPKFITGKNKAEVKIQIRKTLEKKNWTEKEI